MIQVLAGAWALLFGMLLLMVGNGMQGTLMALRGAEESFSTLEMSIVISAYFVGFLGGSRMAPGMIRRVGHVRVFAALASMVSAVLILFPTFVDPILWSLGRVVIGFCFSAVYVTAESWLNNTANNENRGKTLSVYMIVQMTGIVTAQWLLLTADPEGFELFIFASVLISISFAPILLSISPTPAFEATKRMTLKELVQISPLGVAGMFLLGGVFSAQFGMSPVYGTEAGLTTAQISLFVSMFFISAMFTQYPIGWISDRMDRRQLILIISALGATGGALGFGLGQNYLILLGAAALIGGVASPLYSLVLAHTNDYLEPEDMASASSGLMFVNGLGAILGPPLTGWMMQAVGPAGFFVFVGGVFAALAIYAAYRTTQRASVPVEETASYAAVSPTASPVAVSAAQEWAIENANDEKDEENAA